MNDAKQTPLIDLLRNVPPDARGEYAHSEIEHCFIPYGRLCGEAADEITRLRAQVETLEWQLTMESITTCHCAAKSAADCGCPGAVWPEDTLRAENGRLRVLLREARDIAADPYAAEYVLAATLARIDAAIKEQP